MRHKFFALAVLITLIARTAPASLWRVSEMQPDIPYGGRANSIAVHPTNDDILIVASESGGLFRSTDRGVTWRHLDGMPEHMMHALAFHPMDASVVIATTLRDFRTTNGGGTWRSADGGTTWTQMPSPPPIVCPPLVPCAPAPPSGWGISIAPDTGRIYVGTSYGVSYSADRGVTWTYADPFGAGARDRSVIGILALQNDIVIAGGPAGLRRSTDGGVTWRTPAVGIPTIRSFHAFDRSPFWIDQAYAVGGNLGLYYTENGGDTWTKIPGTPVRGGACGGIPFVKAQRNPLVPPVPDPINNGVMLWFGETCWLWTLFGPQLGARSYDYSGTWAPMAIDHMDTRDLAFENAGPALLLGTDGGVHKTIDGGTHWTLAGGGRNGYNALQIYEVKGQAITSQRRYDLYFGTQDNRMWASGDAGRTWPAATKSEGFFIDAAHRLAFDRDSTITYESPTSGSTVQNDSSKPLFVAERVWPEPQLPVKNAPVLLSGPNYVEGIEQGTFSRGMAYTTNYGTTWAQYAAFPEDRWMQARLSQPGTIPVLAQAIRLPAGYSLMRVTRRAAAPTAVATYPLMNNFGGLGLHKMEWTRPAVFAIDPADSKRLIAADVINRKMMQTTDGGNNWSEIPTLTSLVTDSGRFQFTQGEDTHASAISFNKDSPLVVAVGTHQGGILISEDRGVRWAKVAGSERVTRISSIEWKSAGEATVSTYGRGLWRLSTRWILLPPWFETYCRSACTTKAFAGVNPNETYSRAILVFHGQILGGRAVNGVLKELFVTPASSVAFMTDSGELEGVTVTESETEVGFSGTTPPAPPAGQSLVGLTLGKNMNLLGAAFTTNPLVAYEPTETEKSQDTQPVGSEQSPTAGKPYMTLSLGELHAVEPRASLTVSGTGFPALLSLDIKLDDIVSAKVKTGDQGTFAVGIIAPDEIGMHAVSAVDANGKVMDRAPFSVVAGEEEEHE